MDTKSNILIVDDESSNIDHIVDLLDGQDYQLSMADSGVAAWELLTNEPDKFDVVLLAKVMPEMDGVELTEKIMQHEELHCTVILQTEGDEELDVGAQYYISKLLLDKEFKTIHEAHALASLLSENYPEPHKVITGLTELMVNAVEHGNLAIDYSEKTAFTVQGTLSHEIQRRLNLSEYRDRYVTVHFQLLKTMIAVTVKDQGVGFDWKKYMEFDPTRLMDPHGRGIAISNKLSFDELEYKGSGSEVVARLHL